MGDPRVSATELRCVAPLVTLRDNAAPVLVGAVTIVTNGDRAIACSSAELLRNAAEPLAIYTRLDGSSHVPVARWTLGRRGGIGLIELPAGTAFSLDVCPLMLTNVHATLDTRGAPSALVAFDEHFQRRVVSVHVDNGDPNGDEPIWLATSEGAANVDGAPLFSWMPPDPVLGRGSEVVAVALAVAYRGALAPRGRAPIAELIGLDDLGRALPWAEHTPPPRTELEQVAGEIGKKL